MKVRDMLQPAAQLEDYLCFQMASHRQDKYVGKNKTDDST